MKGKGFCKIDVISDKKNKTVRVGKHIIDTPKFAGWKDFFNYGWLQMVEDYANPTGAKQFAEEFGVSPTTLKKLVNAHVRDVWYKDLEDIGGVNIIRQSCMISQCYGKNKRGKISPSAVKKYSENIDLLRSLDADGLINIIPLLVELNLSLGEFKANIGRGLWKRVIKNSYYHNQMLADKVKSRGMEAMPEVLRLRSTAVKQYLHGRLSAKEALLLQETLAKEKKLTKQFKNFSNVFVDTRGMAEQLGETFNPRWSTRTMKERHDKYTDLILKEKYSDNLFDWLEGEENKFVVNKDGVVATLLKSPLDYHSEGTKMRHCIAGYNSIASRGDYVAYHISSDKEETTCAFYVENGQFKSFNQHHGHCNSKVKDERHIDMRNHLMYTVWSKEKKPFYIGEDDL